MDELSLIKSSFLQALDRAASSDDVERLRVQYLGRNGALTAVLRALKDLPDQERKTKGEAANRLRREMEDRLGQKRAELEGALREGVLKKERLDVTRPGARRFPKGHLHPLTKITREITGIFAGMGFAVADGPEVETEYYNFDALNIPADHPARDMWDTFWLRQNEITDHKSQITNKTQGIKNEKLLLRTHTSPVQIRYMETHEPPIRIIVPGTVYRYEATDASHDIQFVQLEGLMVGDDVSIAGFKAIIGEFFAKLFSRQTQIRLRPSYFPFTEPSFEVDISCIFCQGRGCSVCKRSGWLEIAGAGMVHPGVFKAAGYAPGETQGFAFGMGISRIAMMKYKIPDIRLFHSGDLRFLKQF